MAKSFCGDSLVFSNFDFHIIWEYVHLYTQINFQICEHQQEQIYIENYIVSLQSLISYSHH